ncbi:hypothetical protein C8R42DRAFT_644029 [Lentinula raphanica]|nr:hypothetical protein C8R42DRAFT_644029 [Lentinula raphanica]
MTGHQRIGVNLRNFPETLNFKIPPSSSYSTVDGSKARSNSDPNSSNKRARMSPSVGLNPPEAAPASSTTTSLNSTSNSSESSPSTHADPFTKFLHTAQLTPSNSNANELRGYALSMITASESPVFDQPFRMNSDTTSPNIYDSVMAEVEKLAIQHAMPFGYPIISKKTTSAIFQARGLQADLQKQCDVVAALDESTGQSEIQRVLADVEIAAKSISDELKLIQHPEAAAAVVEALQIAAALERSLVEWRTKVPDASPFRVDNNKIELELNLM